jgi:hypothetical protein
MIGPVGMNGPLYPIWVNAINHWNVAIAAVTIRMRAIQSIERRTLGSVSSFRLEESVSILGQLSNRGPSGRYLPT